MNPIDFLKQRAKQLKQKYQEADKNLGGILPGGGTGNALSNTVRQALKVADQVRKEPFTEAVLAAPVINRAANYGLQKIYDVSEKIRAAEIENQSSQVNNLDFREERKRLLNEANKRVRGAGGKGLIIEPGFVGPVEFDPGRTMFNVEAELYNPNPSARVGNVNQYQMGRAFMSMKNPSPRGGLVAGVPTDSVFQMGDSLQRQVRVTPGMPNWVLAHEFGHLVDSYKNPGIFLEGQGDEWDPGALDKMKKTLAQGGMKNPTFIDLFELQGIGDMPNNMLRERRARFKPTRGGMLGIGTGLQGTNEQSLGGAILEGAAVGLVDNLQTLGKEARADYYGRQMAKKAGVPWNELENLSAKGTYFGTAALPAIKESVLAETLSRAGKYAIDVTGGTIQGIADTIRGGPPSVMQGMEQYGYDPAIYGGLRKPDGTIGIRKRNPMESLMYRGIRTLRP